MCAFVFVFVCVYVCMCVFQQVKEQQTFLDDSLSLWSKFQSQRGVFEDWLSLAEELVTRDSYGYTLKETEAYCNSIKVHHFTKIIVVCLSVCP